MLGWRLFTLLSLSFCQAIQGSPLKVRRGSDLSPLPTTLANVTLVDNRAGKDQSLSVALVIEPTKVSLPANACGSASADVSLSASRHQAQHVQTVISGPRTLPVWLLPVVLPSVSLISSSACSPAVCKQLQQTESAIAGPQFVSGGTSLSQVVL